MEWKIRKLGNVVIWLELPSYLGACLIYLWIATGFYGLSFDSSSAFTTGLVMITALTAIGLLAVSLLAVRYLDRSLPPQHGNREAIYRNAAVVLVVLFLIIGVVSAFILDMPLLVELYIAALVISYLARFILAVMLIVKIRHYKKDQYRRKF